MPIDEPLSTCKHRERLLVKQTFPSSFHYVECGDCRMVVIYPEKFPQTWLARDVTLIKSD